jgi:hypothetical protein
LFFVSLYPLGFVAIMNMEERQKWSNLLLQNVGPIQQRLYANIDEMLQLLTPVADSRVRKATAARFVPDALKPEELSGK